MFSSNKVDGTKPNNHNVMLYTLSTCIWCKKAKKLLERLGTPYEFINVDELSGSDKAEAVKELGKFNPRCTFPTMVIDNKNCIVGFKEDQIKKVLS